MCDDYIPSKPALRRDSRSKIYTETCLEVGGGRVLEVRDDDVRVNTTQEIRGQVPKLQEIIRYKIYLNIIFRVIFPLLRIIREKVSKVF